VSDERAYDQVRGFMNAHAEDVQALQWLRVNAYGHPLGSAYRSAEAMNVDGALARAIVTPAAASIETMLRVWQRHAPNAPLEAYFTATKAAQRAHLLTEAFAAAGIASSEAVEAFVAVTYLRDVVGGGVESDDDRGWVEAQGFHDTQGLTTADFTRIEDAVHGMMRLCAQLPIVDEAIPTRYYVAERDDVLRAHRAPPGILGSAGVSQILWNDLERAFALVYDDVEQATITEPFTWHADLDGAAIRALPDLERRQRFHAAARRAGEAGLERLARHRPLAREALAQWRAYWQRAIVAVEPDVETVLARAALPFTPYETFRVHASDAQLFAYPKGDDASAIDHHHRLRSVGRLALAATPNATAANLFSLLLPCIDPERAAEYLSEGERATALFRVGIAWKAGIG
jgi:hypothetical protein